MCDALCICLTSHHMQIHIARLLSAHTHTSHHICWSYPHAYWHAYPHTYPHTYPHAHAHEHTRQDPRVHAHMVCVCSHVWQQYLTCACQRARMCTSACEWRHLNAQMTCVTSVQFMGDHIIDTFSAQVSQSQSLKEDTYLSPVSLYLKDHNFRKNIQVSWRVYADGEVEAKVRTLRRTTSTSIMFCAFTLDNLTLLSWEKDISKLCEYAGYFYAALQEW